ncbi:uncharacterized protein LOC134687826 [Mytilus trossulus]|uniref:uncharacterized protein LOC134687826 n=1 Tax=Mytilus trossulus TaxID=6551 RepID=UPI00300776B3
MIVPRILELLSNYYDGTDEIIEGEWVWAETGKPLTYTNWVPGTPDLHKPRDENCLEIVKWTDHVGDFWIGGTDEKVEGEWLWVESGNPLTYTNWAPGTPDLHLPRLEHCLEIVKMDKPLGYPAVGPGGIAG